LFWLEERTLEDDAHSQRKSGCGTDEQYGLNTYNPALFQKEEVWEIVQRGDKAGKEITEVR